MSRILALVFALVGIGLSGCLHDEQGEPPNAESAPHRAVVPFRARPLRLPRMPFHTCRMTPELSPATAEVPGRPSEAALGDGPVYVAFPAIPRILDVFPPKDSGLPPSRWRVGETVWISAPGYRGPVLVRGRRVDGPGRLGFGKTRSPSWELLLPAGTWDQRAGVLGEWKRAVQGGWRFAKAKMRVRVDGCYAMQIDGRSFSDVIVFVARLQSY